MPTIQHQTLRPFGYDLFEAAGLPEDQARIAMDHLVDANLTGHDSHGLIRVPQYLDMIEQGRITTDAKVEVLQENRLTAIVDGHWGFGQVTMTRAVEVGLAKAGQHGIAAVTARHTNHIGRLGSYVDRIAREGLIGLLFVNAVGTPAFRMTPWGGTEPRLVTDPLAFGIPSPSGDPIVLDMTTTVVAEGKVRLRRNRGEQAPDGWLLDAEGRATNDPNVLYLSLIHI